MMKLAGLICQTAFLLLAWGSVFGEGYDLNIFRFHCRDGNEEIYAGGYCDSMAGSTNILYSYIDCSDGSDEINNDCGYPTTPSPTTTTSKPIADYAQRITLCRHDEFGGRCIEQDINETCFNLWDFNEQMTSIDTHGACVLIWEHANCEGNYRRVDGKLGHVGSDFNDVASAIQLCPNRPEIDEVF